jgi:hypothetical protein
MAVILSLPFFIYALAASAITAPEKLAASPPPLLIHSHFINRPPGCG